jgi:hypothetical protein
LSSALSTSSPVGSRRSQEGSGILEGGSCPAPIGVPVQPRRDHLRRSERMHSSTGLPRSRSSAPTHWRIIAADSDPSDRAFPSANEAMERPTLASGALTRSYAWMASKDPHVITQSAPRDGGSAPLTSTVRRTGATTIRTHLPSHVDLLHPKWHGTASCEGQLLLGLLHSPVCSAAGPRSRDTG